MDLANFFSSDIYSWVVLPLFIFFARVFDVTLGTLRIIFLSRGKRFIAPLLGFFEVFIWIVAVSQLVRNLSNIAGFLAYAAGFAAGNYIGLWIEDRLALGTLSIRTIMTRDSTELVKKLHEGGYGVTAIDAHGSVGDVKVIYTIIKRKDLPHVLSIIHDIVPKAFLSIEEVRSAAEGIFPPSKNRFSDTLRFLVRGLRK